MNAIAILTSCCALLLAAADAHATEECGGLKWDVSTEHALFIGRAARLRSGAHAAAAPELRSNRLYELLLAPEGRVTFAAAPGNTRGYRGPGDGTFAGIAKFTIATDGTYRVSGDLPFWIDVVDAGTLVRSKDFDARRGCVPQKIVEYDLRAGRPLILQVSAAPSKTVHVSITYVADASLRAPSS